MTSLASQLESDEQERKLFVGGLNKDLTDEDHLKTYFKEFGDIIDCTIMRDPQHNSRGFGFVLFESPTSIDDIIASKKDGGTFTLDGHQIEVKRALPKVPGGNAGSSRTGGANRKIFVGGLPNTIDESDLRKYFERFGRVNEVEILRDRETHRIRGFAFVTFADEDSADKCIQRRTHEICKKVCEVKRAQTRSNLTRFENENNFNRDDRDKFNNPSSGSPGGSGLSMVEVNQLIQQAFAMGQQSVIQPSVQPPTATSLLGIANAAYSRPAVQNPLLQALLNQQQAVAPAPIQAPPVAAPAVPAAPAATAAANTTGAINQLAQLLQGRGIDPNTLSALLKNDQDQGTRSNSSSKSNTTNGNYGTTYPPSSGYDVYYNQQSNSSYGPSKDGDGKRSYHPY